MFDPQNPSFSICIPIYNHGAYIADTIQSVLNQTYQNFEIVIADNASTDNSVEVIERFNDPRIRLIRNRYNIGFAPNLQRVTMYAKNDFINLLSSDDQMKPNALEVYAKVISKMAPHVQNLVLFSKTEHFDNNNNVTYVTEKSPDSFYNQHIPATRSHETPITGDDIEYQTYQGHAVLAESLAQLRTFAPFLSIAYSRSLWEAIEGYNAVRTIGPDKFFNYKLLFQNPVVVYVPHILYRYREYASLNRATQRLTLKQVIDDYLYTIEYKDADLQPIGLSRQRLINTFIDKVCLKQGLSELGRRNYFYGFSMFAFSMAAYPGVALRNSKFYMLMALLFTGPLATRIAPLLLSWYHRGKED
ncbi:MAG: glycosyltransferase [Anaerolineae bacterium]|nr:glycosyltransferase [Anaerolineae bacterium]